MAAQKPLIYAGNVRQELPATDWVARSLTGLQPETGALLDAMTVQPYTGRVALIDWTLLRLKTTGLWTKLDGIWFFAAHDAQAARLNWRSPGSFAFTEVNSITFTEDAGYTGDGSSMYLSSDYIPGTSGTQYTQDNAHLGIVVMTATTSAGIDVAAGAPPTLRIRARTGSDTFFINDTTGLTYTGADVVPSHSVISRRDSTNGVYFINGVSVATFSVASTGTPVTTGLIVGRAGASSHADRRWSCVHVGASLTDTENSLIAQIVGEYLAEVGAL